MRATSWIGVSMGSKEPAGYVRIGPDVLRRIADFKSRTSFNKAGLE